MQTDNTASSSRRPRGLVPRAILAVKPYTVVVGEGDNVGRIAERMTGDASRYHELVSANTHKPRADAPQGYGYQTFLGLAAGEELLVPSDWPDPSDLPKEALGLQAGPDFSQISVSQFDPFLQTLMLAWPAVNLVGGQPATGEKPEDIAKVLYAWWPYVQQQAGTMIGGVKWPSASDLPSVLQNSAQLAYLGRLAASAGQFLSKTGAPADVALKIPWDQVPWDKVPWAQIKYASPGGQQSEFWALLKSAQTPQWNAGSRLGGAQFVSGLQSLALSAGPTSGDLADVNWGAAEYQNVGWTEVPWTDIAWDNAFGDGKLLQCYSKNVGRWAEMGKCKECYQGKGVDFLKKYLCDTSLDVCFCKAITGPGKIEPGKDQPGGTVNPTQPNFGCTPFPQCLAEQGNWPSGLPHPCEPFPGCVPEWAKTQPGGIPGGTPGGTSTPGKTGGTGTPGTTTQPGTGGAGTTGTGGAGSEPAKDNTMLWVLGGTAAVAFTVAVVAVVASR